MATIQRMNEMMSKLMCQTFSHFQAWVQWASLSEKLEKRVKFLGEQ